MKKIFSLLILMNCTLLFGELKYEQDLTLTSFVSYEDVKQRAECFCLAAKNDSDMKVKNVCYKQRKLGKDRIAYEAVIICYVSEIDVDLRRILTKATGLRKNLSTSP